MVADREIEGVFENGVVRITDDNPPKGTPVRVRIVKDKRKAKPKSKVGQTPPKERRRSQASPEMMRLVEIIKIAPRDAFYDHGGRSLIAFRLQCEKLGFATH